MSAAGAEGEEAKRDPTTRAALVCELELALHTWDGVVESKPVCVKWSGQPISIPERILLRSSKKVNIKRYCEAVGGERNGAFEGCVWNRRFYVNYPMAFRIQTPNGIVPIGKYVGLVRVLRNGKAIYTWESKQAPNAPSLDIPTTVITAPEYFREPVDLGLFLLESGAEAATAAASTQYEIARVKWSTALGSALSAAVLAEVPPELEDAYSCFSTRLRYLEARARSDDAATLAATARMASIDRRSTELGAGLKDAGSAEVASSASFDPPPSETVDGEKLADGQVVLQLDRSGSNGQLLRSRSGRKWEQIKPSEAGAMRRDISRIGDVGSTPPEQLWFITVRGGNSANTTYAFSSDVTGLAPLRIVTTPVGCKAPENSLRDLNAAVNDYIKEGASSGKIAREVESQRERIAAFLHDNKASIEVVLAMLPPSTRDRIRRGFFWARYVEDITANALGASDQLQAAVPVIKARVEAALRSPEERLRAYNAAVAALPQEDSFWSRPLSNPAPGAGESRFSMRYVTPRQTYWFLAWNGIPMPVMTSSGVRTELHVENLIPIVDVFGEHYQNDGPWPSLGWGVGLFGTRETVQPESGDKYVTNFNVGPQASISISNLRIGASYVIREADDCNERCFLDRKNYRVVLGADLVRLVSGKSAALKTESAEGRGSD